MKNRSIIIKRLGVEDGLWNDLYHRLMRLTWPRFFALSLLLFLGLNLIFALLFSFQNGSIANIKEHSQVSLIDSARARAHQVRNAIVAVNHFVCGHPWMAVVIGTGMGWLTRSVLTPRRS